MDDFEKIPHELKEFVLKDFQKHLDDEPAIRGEKLTIENYFHYFHETNLEKTFNLLILSAANNLYSSKSSSL